MQCISVCSYNERQTPAGWDFPNISRPYSIIYYALGGSAYYSAGSIEISLEKNHLYILPADKTFSLREDSCDKFYATYLHAYTSPKIETLVDIDVSKDPFIERTLDFLRHYVKVQDEIYVRRLTDMLLAYIFERLGECYEPLSTKIKHYIDENFVSVFKENDISRKFNYSNSHLSKIFKEKYKSTPKQYAKKLVLKEIVHLLSQEVSIAEISERLSFSSPENLSRFFKSCYGCSPTEYKKRFRNFPF